MLVNNLSLFPCLSELDDHALYFFFWVHFTGVLTPLWLVHYKTVTPMIVIVSCYSSLKSLILNPPIGNKELNPLSSSQLAGFRLHPGQVSFVQFALQFNYLPVLLSSRLAGVAEAKCDGMSSTSVLYSV